MITICNVIKTSLEIYGIPFNVERHSLNTKYIDVVYTPDSKVLYSYLLSR